MIKITVNKQDNWIEIMIHKDDRFYPLNIIEEDLKFENWEEFKKEIEKLLRILENHFNI